MKSSGAMQANHHTCHPKTPFMVWPCDEKRIHERCKASNNNEDGREDTSRKAQTEVDGQGAERFETTPARSKARTAPNGEMQSWRSTPPGIGSAKVSKGEHPGNESSLIRTHVNIGSISYQCCHLMATPTRI